MNKGKVIVVEGACDGIGKSTQCELLEKFLLAAGSNIVKHHFPTYDSYQGEMVKRYLEGEYGKPNELSPYFVNCLYAADRAVTWRKDLKEEYDSGRVILLDRYTTSSLIYQAAVIDDLEERKAFVDYVCDFEYTKLGIKKPDVVIFLYAPFDLVTKMRSARKQNDGVSNDIHERDLSYMKKVYDNAMFLADYLGWCKVKCNDGEQMRPIDEIHKEICALVSVVENNKKR